jgi:hypothetical protein
MMRPASQQLLRDQEETNIMSRTGLALIVLLSASACGASSNTTPASPATAAEPAPVAAKSSWEPPPMPTDGAIGLLGLTAPEKPWASMSYDEKEWYMVGKVHPVMRQIFQTMDAAKYEGEKFECAPCHGDNAKAKMYKMPGDHLSVVPAYGTEDWKAMENSRIVKFMAQRVTPAMAQLVGEKPFDPATGQGYSCWSCHPKQ